MTQHSLWERQNYLKIIVDFPPNIKDIKNRFTLTGRELFAWGDIIFNPSGSKVPKQLLAHEHVHSKQQGDKIKAWWDRYLIDKEFRLSQELEAHQVEYYVFCKNEPNRNRRRIYLKIVAKKLSSRIYGKMITFGKAKELIRK